MEFGGRDVERGDLGVRDLDASLVGVLIEPAADDQTLGCHSANMRCSMRFSSTYWYRAADDKR